MGLLCSWISFDLLLSFSATNCSSLIWYWSQKIYSQSNEIPGWFEYLIVLLVGNQKTPFIFSFVYLATFTLFDFYDYMTLCLWFSLLLVGVFQQNLMLVMIWLFLNCWSGFFSKIILIRRDFLECFCCNLLNLNLNLLFFCSSIKCLVSPKYTSNDNLIF